MTDLLLTAFLLSLVLLGIHSYFGMEIIRRGIIFTDLAIGQAAALGAAVSLVFAGGKGLYAVSLAFALAVGVTIALLSRRRVHLEAVIGLLYAFGLSGVILVLSRSGHGTETFQRLTAADILFTPKREVFRTAFLYAGLGAAAVASRRFLRGVLREILFFVLFAVTVTSSVRLAGVLVVFALLVAPSLVAIRIGTRKPLAAAWAVGTAVNLAAIALSYRLDLPTGYAIVFLQAAAALAVILVRSPGAASSGFASRGGATPDAGVPGT